MQFIEQSRFVKTAPQPVRPQQPSPSGLYAKWELVDGRLTCIWLRHPD